MMTTPTEAKQIEAIRKKFNLPRRPSGSDWTGTIIKDARKGLGYVTEDDNGMYRVLTVRYLKGGNGEIIMNNVGPNPPEIKYFFWLMGNEWASFGL